MQLLMRVLDALLPPSRDALIMRKLTEPEVLVKLSPEPVSLHGHAGAALMPYRARHIGALVREAKFRGSDRAYELLACVLNEYLSGFLEDREAYEARTLAIIPVPLSKKRFRERGYNQVDEVVKRTLFKEKRMPGALRRVRDTKAQTSLGRDARAKNLYGAFSASELDPSFLYMVVDDVYTTGATLGEAVRALEAGGARHIVPIALSY